ncbi:MAG TPA: aldose epimerase family protein [Xanthobacteraceae bacterium]|nr:aldose epimerase family protein [Xanthobacteraceae bacterium]
MLDRSKFQTGIDGKPVDLYILRNSRGMVVAITNLGAKIEQILVPDRKGVLGDVALGYDSIEAVRNGQSSMGAFIGRYANRIAGGKFSLDGNTYQLAINNGPNSLHGGHKGSRFVVFDARQIDQSTVEMRYVFRDGEEHYPGNLATIIGYKVTEENELVLSWHAVSDRRTIANFTGHTFFNLRGHASGDILDHIITINADHFTPIDANLIPTGEIRPVAGTPLDLTQPNAIGARIDADDLQIKLAGGYDHNYVLNKPRLGETTLAARVVDPASGRMLEVSTTEPGMQFFSGNTLEGKHPRDIGKDGAVYRYRNAFCLEPQHFPDSPNHPNFPSTIVDPEKPKVGKIIYKFSIA